jgi:rhodanese-related sulfurtransferase
MTQRSSVTILPLLHPEEVRGRLRAKEEFAFIDVREEAAFSRSQPLFAVNLPLSRLEERAYRLLPRRRVPIVLFDNEEGLAERAAASLRQLGYVGDIAAVAGGLSKWRESGGELFRDIGVPSKSFGEWLEAQAHTPSISAEELKSLLDAKSDVVVLDCRPFSEYRMMTIPGAVNCPGAELVLSAAAAAPSPDSLLVVHCAGRTRSLIGAQSLVNSGLFSRVAALRNGTMGWLLAGFELEHGARRRVPVQRASDGARRAARGLAERSGVRFLSSVEAARWESESEVRSLFRFDVRSPEETEISHAPGFASAPGGQLVQATDEFVGVGGARLLLADDDGVRAAMTGSWLRQLGWPEVGVLEDGLAPRLVSGPAPAPPLPASPPGPTLGIDALQRLLAAGEATVIDLARSPDHARGHLPGAWFAIRSRLAEGVPALPRTAAWVLTSPDGLTAAFARAELQALTTRQVLALEGGTNAWAAAGLPLEPNLVRLAVPADDVYKRPYEGTDSPRAAMQGYLDWEFGLVEQINRDGSARFGVVTPLSRS